MIEFYAGNVTECDAVKCILGHVTECDTVKFIKGQVTDCDCDGVKCILDLQDKV